MNKLNVYVDFYDILLINIVIIIFLIFVTVD